LIGSKIHRKSFFLNHEDRFLVFSLNEKGFSMPELIAENTCNHISCHTKRAVAKQDLDNIYFGVCKISNSFDRLKTKLASMQPNSKIKRIADDLNVCKELIKQIYIRFGLTPPKYIIYIDADSSKEFIKKLNFVISETIFRCAAICNCDNVKKFTDFSLIIMVLADLNKSLAL